MKKALKTILFAMLITLVAVVFSACQNGTPTIDNKRTVDVPTGLRIEQGVLVWDNVTNADKYTLWINEKEVELKSSTYSDFESKETYTVKVKAENVWYESEWSEEFTFNCLANPLSIIYSRDKFYFTEVQNASGYVIDIDGVQLTIPAVNGYDYLFTSPGVKNVKIRAIGDNITYFDSAFSVNCMVKVDVIEYEDILSTMPIGEGVEEEPYLISSLGEFKWIQENQLLSEDGFNSIWFKQTCDLDFRYVDGYIPIGTSDLPFNANYNGDNFKINYLNIESSKAGIFGSIGSKGEVYNINRNGGTTQGIESAGGIVAINFGTVYNCKNSSEVNAKISGGIIGENTESRIILNCVNSANIVGEDAGGIVGWNWNGTISTCENKGYVSGINRSGGIVAMNGGYVIYAINNGEVKGVFSGGIVGENIENITLSVNYGEVKSSSVSGGIAGQNIGEIKYVYNMGNVMAYDDMIDVFAGGIVGKMNDGIMRCSYNLVQANGSGGKNSKFGGIAGYYRSGFIDNVYIFESYFDKAFGNTDKFIGDIHAVTQDEFYSSEFVDELNSLTDTDDKYVYFEVVWKFNEGNYPKLYFEK